MDTLANNYSCGRRCSLLIIIIIIKIVDGVIICRAGISSGMAAFDWSTTFLKYRNFSRSLHFKVRGRGIAIMIPCGMTGVFIFIILPVLQVPLV